MFTDHVFRFQHTAARRRLELSSSFFDGGGQSFNTQPPEGGWALSPCKPHPSPCGFNTQPPEGGWLSRKAPLSIDMQFQHTAARRRLALIFD